MVITRIGIVISPSELVASRRAQRMKLWWQTSPGSPGPMPTERLSMRDTREILRQKWLLGRSHRAIAESLGVSAGVVGLAARRASDAGLKWEAIEAIDDAELERRLYPAVVAAS